MIKMKGSAHTDNGDVWDSYDLVVPPVLPDATFIGTNFILTPNQTQSQCPGVEELCNCTAYPGDVTKCCPAGQHTEFGRYVGGCSADGVHCEMKGWCPFETKPENKDQNLLRGIEDWTLFARINGRFPRYNRHVANTDSNPSMDAPNNLTLWSMDGIVEKAGTSFDDYKYKGGVILASFVYNCNLDHDIADCVPEITFSRLDDPNDPVSSGFNFRYQMSSRDLATQQVTRDLWKLYGIYVVFSVSGTGGHFDLTTLSTTLGSGFAFLSFAAVVCDLCMQYLLPGGEKLMAEKTRAVHAEELVLGLDSGLLANGDDDEVDEL